MTKQQEIKEGLVDKLSERYGWNPNYMEFHNGVVGEILSYLHSQGVVLRVNRELPKIPYEHKPVYCAESIMRQGAKEAQHAMLNAGYVAVEPLVDTEQKQGV